jgi:AraC-like DNA-binding protein
MPRVLIADSDDLVRKTLVKLTRLACPDACVVDVIRGTDAQAELVSKDYDLAVLDLHLGDLDTLQIARVVRQAEKATVIVVMSDEDPEVLATQCQGEDGFQLMSKPFGPGDYLGLVRRLLGDCPPATEGLADLIDAWIKDHCCRVDLHVADICREFGICKTYVSRLLQTRFHAGFAQRREYHRIQHAKTLLGGRDNGMLLKQIAAQCGFRTPARFSEAFRRQEGVSPNHFGVLGRSTRSVSGRVCLRIG